MGLWKKLSAWYDVQKHRARTRQIVSVLVSLYAVLTAAVPGLHLHPEWIAGILAAFGPVVIGIEHYVDDPSTGNAVAAIQAVETAVKEVDPPPAAK